MQQGCYQPSQLEWGDFHPSKIFYCFLHKLVNWSVRFSLAKTGFLFGDLRSTL